MDEQDLEFAGSGDLTEDAGDLVSPLSGKSMWRVLATIGVAIIVPGGLYVLAALVVSPLVTRRLLRQAADRAAEGDVKRALRSTNRAVRLSRGSATALAQRATLHLRQGDLDKALADAERAVERKPDSAFAQYVRATVHDMRGEEAAALAHYMRFLDLADDSDEARAAEVSARIEALGAAGEN